MALLDIFSKRQSKLRGEVPDVYQYDLIPEKLRVQFVHILRDLLHRNRSEDYYHKPGVQEAYEIVVESLCREYGLFRLSGTGHQRNYP